MVEPADVETLARQLLATFPREGSVAVALSGGVDSAVVAEAAFLACGTRATAITADSPSVPRRDLADAAALASQIGIQHQVLATLEFENAAYTANDAKRCYHCKSTLYETIRLHPEFAGSWLCSGANIDDTGDYRPGLIAASEREIHHPLILAGIGKAGVRLLAKYWNLSVAEKPASPCLSSRIATGVEVTPERTSRIEAAENYLRELGFSDCRVRLHHGELARVELPRDEISKLFVNDAWQALESYFRTLGFAFVTLDLTGLRSGSMNQLIDLTVRQKTLAELQRNLS
jgi:pyridinium-3,5-biscarboxylic acid mononucleotide sulfurtransferase